MRSTPPTARPAAGNPPSLDQHDVDIAAACRVEQALAGFSLRRPGANLPHLQ
jgi:hypothetical protein